MKNLLLLVAVGCLSLALAAPAQAQFYPRSSPSYGLSLNIGYAPSYGYPSYGYTPSYAYRPGHLDCVPGGFVPHRGHLHYVQPHTDYHLGGRRYEVQPTPWGPQVSPFPHYGR